MRIVCLLKKYHTLFFSKIKERCHKVCPLLQTFVCLFVFVALRPMSTAMVIAGRSVHLTTLLPGQA